MVENSKDIVYYYETKPTFKYRYLSPAIEKILSPNLVEESMKNPYTAFELIHPDDYHVLRKKVAGELDYSKPIVVRWRNDEGRYMWFEEYTTPIYENGEVVAIHGIIRNIDDKVSLQQQLEYKALHDRLTGMYNREYFESLMDKYDKHENVPIGIVVCDLDGLKLVNDKYGHKDGDKLIRETSNILQNFTRKNITVARIGGDEFAILLVNVDPSDTELFMTKIQNEVDLFNAKGTSFEIKLSIGIAYSCSSLGEMEALFVKADTAMYEDKHKKRLVGAK